MGFPRWWVAVGGSLVGMDGHVVQDSAQPGRSGRWLDVMVGTCLRWTGCGTLPFVPSIPLVVWLIRWSSSPHHHFKVLGGLSNSSTLLDNFIYVLQLGPV